MKIIVISDTHGLVSDSYLSKVREVNDAEILIHVGDTTKDAKEIADELKLDLVNVKGNCDYKDMSTEEIIEIELAGKNFFITHGDKMGIKGTLEVIKYESGKNNADVVIFGHTHKPFKEIIDGVLYFNPGSPSCPRENSKRSFGVIEIKDGDIKSEIVYI